MEDNSFAQILKEEFELVKLRGENLFFKAVDRRWKCALCTEEVRYAQEARDALGFTGLCKIASAQRTG